MFALLLLVAVVVAVAAFAALTPTGRTVTPAPVKAPATEYVYKRTTVPGEVTEIVGANLISARLTVIRRMGGHITTSSPIGGNRYMVTWVPNGAR